MERRGTLANITNLQGRMSMLGPPARTKPQEGTPRASLLPRPSISGNPRASIQNPRASIQNPRASIQNPRGSLVPSSRPSLNQSGIRRLNLSTAGGQRKDPRDWKDKGFVVTCQKRMMKFLTEAGYPYALGPKTLSAPSNKEFYQMFQFLYQRLNPTYVFGPKPEDEVLPLLTAMNYPFKVAKNSLITPGAPHVWPSLMGVMMWMVELSEYCDALGRCQDEGFGFEEDDDDRDKWICNSIAQSYGAWLEGKDEEFDRLNGEMLSFFESRRQMALSSVEGLSQSIENLSAEIDRIQNAPSRVVALSQKKDDFLRDISKIKNYIANLQDQREAVMAAITQANATVEAEQREIEQRIKENQDLQAIINAQEITPADAERMMSARNTLEKSLQQLCEQREAVQQDVWDKEVEVQKASDSLDRTISEFNATAKKLRLLGPSAKYPEISNTFKNITFSPHAASADKIVNCSIKQDIAPCLQQVKERLINKTKVLHDKYVDLNMEYEVMVELVDEQREALHSLEVQLGKSVQAYKANKLSHAEANKRTQAEMENARQEAARIRSEMATMLAQSEKAVAGAAHAVEEHDKTCSREREAMVQFITETLGALMEHKSNITDILAALNQKLDEELAVEL